MLVAAFAHPKARAHERDLVTDRPGRSQTPNRGTYGSGLERSSAHEVELERFVRELAAFLDGHAVQRSFDRLVVAAPSRVVGKLRKLVSGQVRERTALELVHDYTEIAPQELDRRLAASRGKTKRAASV